LTIEIIVLIYVIIGFIFRPYSRDYTLIQGLTIHVFWLPALLLAVLCLRQS